MATIATSRPVGGVSSIFNTTINAVVAWNNTRNTRKVLHSLTPRELSDIGLNVGDIESVANGTYL